MPPGPPARAGRMARVRGRLFEQVQAELLALIRDGNLEPGDPLPSEGDLAERLGVSRLSLREATRTLQALGVIESRPGRGLFVKGFAFDAILRQLPYSLGAGGAALRELLEVRQALEVSLVAKSAALLSASDLNELDGLLVEMARLEALSASTEEPDRAFHQCLFRPLGNRFLLDLIELFWNLHHGLASQMPGKTARVAERHRNIVSALRAGTDPSPALLDHFAEIWTRLGSIEDVPAERLVSHAPDLTGPAT